MCKIMKYENYRLNVFFEYEVKRLSRHSKLCVVVFNNRISTLPFIFDRKQIKDEVASYALDEYLPSFVEYSNRLTLS